MTMARRILICLSVAIGSLAGIIACGYFAEQVEIANAVHRNEK